MNNSKLNIKHSKFKRFTLMELMAVIFIIGILATLVLKNIGGAMDDADALTVRAELKAVADATKAYEMEYGVLPVGITGTADLNLLVKTLKAITVGTTDTTNKKRRKFLDSKLLTKLKSDGSGDYEAEHHYDMWGGVVAISGSATAGYTLTSPGPDGDDDTGDEVTFEWE